MELYIKHKNNMDVCYKVLRILNFDESSTLKVKSILCNQGFDATYVIEPKPVTLKLKKSDVKNWLYFHNNDSLICVRYGNWLPLQNIIKEQQNG